jgi:hypothetical protein
VATQPSGCTCFACAARPEMTPAHATAPTLLMPPQAAMAREVMAMAAVANHPNIVRFVGACLAPPLVLREHYPRGSLHQLLSRGRAQLAAAPGGQGAVGQGGGEGPGGPQPHAGLACCFVAPANSLLVAGKSGVRRGRPSC